MRFLGFSQVKVLNGGWTGWKRSQLPLSSKQSRPGTGNFRPCENLSMHVGTDEVAARSEDTCLLDCRGAASFRKKPGDDKTGHIPGAINLPFRDVLYTNTGCFKAHSDLKLLFEDVVPDYRNRPVIASCGSGYAATPVILALALLGVSVPLYDGSFAAWRHNGQRPIAH